MKATNDRTVTLSTSRLPLLILAGLLAVSLAANAWSMTKTQPTANIRNKQYNMLNPARGAYEQKDLIINFQPLRDYLNQFEKDQNTSIYFEYLATGANITVAKDAEFYPASLMKLPAAMAVAKKIERGDWRWDNRLVLMAADKDNQFGTLYQQPTGSTFTIEELVERSLRDSDNTAHFILLRNLEASEVEDVYEHIGLAKFLSGNGLLSAKRYSVVFRSLYNSSYLSDENSQKLLSFLGQSAFDQYLGGGLPSDVPFAHKIGIQTEKKVYLDSGIVYLPHRPYILTAMIKSNDEQSAQKMMRTISEKVYRYIEEYKDTPV